jgi:hypothetical protein
VVRRTIRYLYHTDENPFPSCPAPGEPYPRVTLEDVTVGPHCLRFEWSEPVNSFKNALAVDGVVSWLLANPTSWPGDQNDVVTAKEASEMSLRSAVLSHVTYLERNREELQIKQDRLNRLNDESAEAGASGPEDLSANQTENRAKFRSRRLFVSCRHLPDRDSTDLR